MEAAKLIESGQAFHRTFNPSQDISLRVGTGDERDTVKVAPEGIKGMYCIQCGYYFSDSFLEKLSAAPAEAKTLCENCNAACYYDLSGVDIRHHDSQFLSEEKVRESSWFHVTTNDDWLEDMQAKGDEVYSKTPIIHVGSREAALDRMRDIAKWQNDGSTWYLYELKVKPEAPVTPGVFCDENDICPSTVGDARKTNYDSEGVTRYLNSYEGPGTVSLAANPNAFVEVRAVVIPMD